ncbi:uncharacterized protein V6R79_006839 [Siganus canaliculatus]
MTLPNFALFVTSLFGASMAPGMTLKESFLHLESAAAGGTVTLPCSCHGDGLSVFYWYKQHVGQIPKQVSAVHDYSSKGVFHDEFNNSRFSLDNRNLKISDLHVSDSATYYCIGSYSLHNEFCSGTIVIVEGSGVTVPALVHQSTSGSIQSGDSVTLNCTVHTGTCDGEHSVYWFKHSEESHPGLIYTHGDRNDQCERKDNTHTHTCVYNLPLKDLDVSHAGTYYCAVASCGHILFGNGTKLDFKDKVGSLVYVLSAALLFVTMALAFSLYKLSRKKSQFTECDAKLSATSVPDTIEQDADSLHYAAIKVHTSARSASQRTRARNECVYAAVQQ